MAKTRTCKYCKKEFISKRNAKYCCERCRELGNKEYNSKYRKSPLNQSDVDENGNLKKVKKHKENNLIEDTKKARELGLTYGQYIGSIYAKKNPIVRKWW